jgi:hypothetical protein
MTCRNLKNDVKTGMGPRPGIKTQAEPVYGLGGVRHGGGVNVAQALVRNVGTCCLDAKGETQVVSHTRVRVPMRGTGAEQLVVALKSQKWDGAKGLRHLALFVGQPEKGGAREPGKAVAWFEASDG